MALFHLDIYISYIKNNHLHKFQKYNVDVKLFYIYHYNYLTISEDGINNRPWKKEEIENIKNIFDGLNIKENGYYKEELWRDQLSKMDSNIIERYIRKLKLKKL